MVLVIDSLSFHRLTLVRALDIKDLKLNMKKEEKI